MEYINVIKMLCNKASDPSQGYAQITIDFFEEFESQFFDQSRDFKEEPITRDELGAKAYEIGNITQVIDRVKFKKDYEIFERMHQQLHLWQERGGR